MTTIPERIREEAGKTLEGMAVAFNGTGGFKVLQERIEQALLAAEKRGREEAAKIADAHAECERDCGDVIAAAIRSTN